jgi:hypothetical protein
VFRKHSMESLARADAINSRYPYYRQATASKTFLPVTIEGRGLSEAEIKKKQHDFPEYAHPILRNPSSGLRL